MSKGRRARGVTRAFVLEHGHPRRPIIAEANRLLELAKEQGQDFSVMSIKSALYRMRKRKAKVARVRNLPAGKELLAQVRQTMGMLTSEIDRLQKIEGAHVALLGELKKVTTRNG